ncbi:hypothetical protein ACM26W_00545 [Halomonas sp. HK25]|uniref:hypothetical protein n=1 Tax=Halomonas sp. HK25 TaxID=3394321 RepID=UPI0039FBB2E4
MHKDTPGHIKSILEAAYAEAVETRGFRAFLGNVRAMPMHLFGEEAQVYLQHWQSITARAMYEASSPERSPEEWVIRRP